MNDLTTSYFSIEKSDKQPDGTLMVYGKATDDSIDIDQQICDAAWLDRAMPAWFRSGGNIREQHSSIAAGVAKEYEPKADGHYIMAHIVDPTSVKKVDAGVLRGFSIGIKSPRVVRDTKAANGRIIDGQIVEVSLVDRPANPNCQLVLAKSVDGESSLIQVEELTEIEKHGSHNQASHGRRGGGLSGRGGGYDSTGRPIGDQGARDNEFLSSQKVDVDDAHDTLDEFANEKHENFKFDLSQNDDNIIEDASEGLKNASENIELAHGVGDYTRHREYVQSAINDLEGARDSLENADDLDIKSVGDDIDGIINTMDVYFEEVNEASKMVKHGSHNQSSHGRRGGAGGGGGAASATAAPKDKVPSARVDRTEQSLSTTQSKMIDTHAAEARGLADDVQGLAKKDNAVRPAARNLTSAAEHLNNASGAKTIGEAKSGIKRAKVSIDRAVSNLEDQNYHTEASHAYSFGKELNSFMTGLGNGVIKEVDADLEKHGSHNQSSHGRRGSGGGAGGGATRVSEVTRESSKKGETSKADAKKGVQQAQGRINEDYKEMAKNEGRTVSMDKERVMDAAQQKTDALNHLSDARNHIAAGKTSETVTSLNNAAAALEGEPQYGPTKVYIKDLATVLEKNPLGKSTDPDLRKALQSALHLYSLNKSEDATMDKALVELPVEVVADLLKFDAAQYESARNALARLIEVEAKEMGEGSNEIQSIGHLLQSVMHLTAWYEGEEAEGEVMEQETMIERAAKSYKNMKPAKDEPKPDFMKRCKDAGMDDDAAKACWDKYMSADVDAEKSAEISKCLECGCNQPGSDHGLTTTNDFANVAKPSNVTTAEMYAPGETPKSAEGEEPVTATEEEVKAEEPATEETPAVETTEVSADEKSTDVEALVEQVVKSATESLKSEIAELVSAKEAALSKAMSLETELELAKSLAVAGGPSRTARPINVKTTNDLLTKAAIYKAKAHATTDPTLAKGYKSLAEEFLNKANEADNK